VRVPIFPLPLVALPDEAVPLHIFEDRYKVLMEACGAGREEASEPFAIFWAGREGVAPIGTLVRVRQVLRRFDDGRMDIIVVGEGRVQLKRVISTRPYLVAEVEPVTDLCEDPDRDLEAAAVGVASRLVGLLQDDADLDGLAGASAFQLAAATRVESDLRLELLASRSERERLRVLTVRLARALAVLEGPGSQPSRTELGSALVN
jgi:Lon protease-like protein